MRHALFATILLLATPAFAQDKPAAPADTSCGKTVKDCQAKFDEQAATIKSLGTAYQAVRQQRDGLQQQLADTQVQTFVQQNNQAAAAKPAAEPPAK